MLNHLCNQHKLSHPVVGGKVCNVNVFFIDVSGITRSFHSVLTSGYFSEKSPVCIMLWPNCPFLHKRSIVTCHVWAWRGLHFSVSSSMSGTLPQNTRSAELTWPSHLAGEEPTSKDDLTRYRRTEAVGGLEEGRRIQDEKPDFTQGSAWFDVIGIMSKQICSGLL